MLPQWIIEKKRDGGELSRQELGFFIDGYTTGRIPDYQMAALAMAVYFRGMSPAETAVLTEVMLRSGDRLNTATISRPKADKHSTGGVGDKVSLILAPLVACFDVAVPMISGRGLGITGGTLDKLESIPGYRTDLSERAFLDVVRECGCGIIGQTARLAPADKKLYALRDVTATVPSIPLIVASILSKKLAEGLDALVLDVKWGSGAFMKSLDEARALAAALVDVGTRSGVAAAAVLTDMNQPLGRTAGNALEVRESIEALAGRGPEDVMDVVYALAARMLVLTGRAERAEDALPALRSRIASGEALARFRRMVQAQGGTPAVVDAPDRLPSAALREPYPAPAGGFVRNVDAESIGRACCLLGAARERTEDRIDPAVGVSDLVKVGQSVRAGDALALLHANDPDRLAAARSCLHHAFDIASEPVDAPPPVTECIDAEDLAP